MINIHVSLIPASKCLVSKIPMSESPMSESLADILASEIPVS